MLYVGLDWHTRTSTCHILDANGRKINERTVKGHRSRMVEHLRSIKSDQPMAICLEASCGYGSLHDELAGFAERIVVAHPGQTRLIFRSKRKNDRIDAQKLAKLLYLDEVPQVYVPGVDARAWRSMIEFRRRQVDLRVRIKNQIRALLRSDGIAKPREVGGLWTKKGLMWLEELTWPTQAATMQRDLLRMELDHVEQAIAKITANLDSMAKDHPGVMLLKTMPGVGNRTAESVVAYIDNPHRFRRSRSVGAYFGLVPCQDASAGVNRLGHITREGPRTPRKMLVEAAWRAIDKSDELRGCFEHLTHGKKERRKIAIVAIAHKLVRIMLAMLKSGESWNGALHRGWVKNTIEMEGSMN
jgi:transposase